jgi:ribosome biogenesis GTPase / thiamine phosphate phosphatase
MTPDQIKNSDPRPDPRGGPRPGVRLDAHPGLTPVLQALGYDEWFAERAESVLEPGQSVARVTAVDRGSYLVRGERGEGRAELSGRLRYTTESSPDLPCVGDWVCVDETSPELAIIQAVLPRKTFVRRKLPGRAVDFQMIAANIDNAFIVQSCHYDFNLRRLDRYLVVAREGGIEPVVVLSKIDLVSRAELETMTRDIREAGISSTVVGLSNNSGEGLDELRGLLAPGKTYCLLGSSGVGKSTLINRLLGSDTLETKAVSATGEGVHTTARRHLLTLESGAMLIDTPGMRELGLLGASDGVEDSFAEVGHLAAGCRFSDCTHTKEPGCAVLAAVDAGELSKDRYDSYLKLKKETEFYDLSYTEKRQKDRDLGRFYKTAKEDVDRVKGPRRNRRG